MLPLPRFIFFTSVILATIAVILLALLSPVTHKKSHSKPWFDMSMYIQPPHTSSSSTRPALREGAGAFIFQRLLTEGPEKTSRVVGKAQGFIIPVEQFEHSPFNVIHLTFDTPGKSGSLSVQANIFGHKDREELRVVGGTGYFAFARGLAVIGKSSDVDASYHVKLQLEIPNHSKKLP